jgi:uncharacterized protein (TIGR02117 family)
MPAWARRVGFGLAGALGLLIAATVLTTRPGDPALWPPPADGPSVAIELVSHGYHAGIAIPRPLMADLAGRQGDAALVAVAQRFAPYPFVEIGWGDEAFYRSVPDAASLTMALAVRALLRPGNASVVHVVGLSEPPRAMFRSADIVRIELSPQGFSRLLHRLDASFARVAGTPQELGSGLYGPSLFFRGAGTFHIFNVCNHWAADLLAVAGLPTAPVLATLPRGLLLDLRWRAGLNPLPRP